MCDEQAAFFVKEVKGMRITYIWQGEENSYTIPFIDEASIENSITCAAVALYMGVTPSHRGICGRGHR